MASYKAFIIYGLFLITITVVVHSIPVGKPNQIIESSVKNNKQAIKSEDISTTSSSTTTSSTTTISQSSTAPTSEEKNDIKKKRYIDEEQLEDLLDNQNDEIRNEQQLKHVLHTKMQETSAKIHDNADKPVDTDDSNVFSDIQMTPSELTDVVRRRRDIKLNDQSNRRRKRALGPYDYYDTDGFYDPYADLIERQPYARPIRSFAPIYWYPSVYQRNIRSALESEFYEPSQWPALYASTTDDDIDNDDIDDDENPLSIYNNDDDDDENDYESNRYPILLQSSNNPFENLQLQQQYNIDDLPIDEDVEENLNSVVDNDDDDDEEGPYDQYFQQERPYYSRYRLF